MKSVLDDANNNNKLDVPFAEKAVELKQAAREGVQKLRSAVEERAPPNLVQTAHAIENSRPVRGLLSISVPFLFFVCSLAVKTLVVALVGSSRTSFALQCTLDVLLISLHVWLNAAESGKRRIKFSKDAVFEFSPHVVPEANAVRKYSTSSTIVVAPAKEEMPSSEPQDVKANNRFVAGSSTTRLESTPVPGVDQMCWKDANPALFKLRQVGYSKTKAKQSSAEAMYRLVRFDLIRNAVSNVGNHAKIQLPEFPKRGVGGLPSLFIVNAQVPDKPPSVFGNAGARDDLGYSIIFYFEINDWVALEPADSKHPGVRLLQRYCAEHDKTPDIRRRFKAMGMVDNCKQLGPGLSSMVETYNGKPAIINKVATIHQGEGWFEVDISIFNFPYVPLKALNSLKDMVAGLGLRAGFVLQGESDEELPEVLIGAGEFCIDFTKAMTL